MTQKEIKELIDDGMKEIEKELGLIGDQAEDVLLEWFTQEFLMGNITREELDDLAKAMGYTVSLKVGDEEVENPELIMGC